MPARRVRSRRLLVVVSVCALTGVGVGIGAALALDGGAARPPVTGTLTDRGVPPLRLESAAGRTTSLAALRGKIVALTPFLTLCHEVCPLTTGAFVQMQQAVDRAGLGDEVAFVEVSVDPWRDTPARLRAFSRLTGIRLLLLTGSKSELARFWRFFGVGFWRTDEDDPAHPDTDWLTHRPLTFDVSHTDGLFLLDARGHERIVDVGMPDVGGHVSRVLRGLLNKQGRSDLAHPEPGWTVRQGLNDVGYLLARRIAPPAGS
jgi:protein SCO1/2